MTHSNDREKKHRSTSSSPCDLAERFLELRRLRKLVADLEQREKQDVDEVRNNRDEKKRK